MRIRWEGQDLQNLLTLPVPKLAKMYGKSASYITTARHRKRKQLKEGKISMTEAFPEGEPIERPELEPEQIDQLYAIYELLKERGMDITDLERASRVNAWNGFYKDAEGESHKVTMAGIELRPDSSLEAWQATPADIRPSRKKAPKRDHKLLFVFSDTQVDFRRVIDGQTNEQELIPIHDENAIRVAQQIAADLQPDEIINCGDTLDAASISRFLKDSDHFFKTFGASFQAIHDMYAQFRADNPDAKIVEVDSNHNERLKKYILQNFPEMYDVYRPGSEDEYPVMSYPYMANLAALDVIWVSGGQEAEYIYGDDYYEEINGRTHPKPLLTFRHGTETGQDGKAAQKIAKNHPETHNVHGHAHSEQHIRRVNRIGQYLASVVVPPLCRTTGEVPSYHNQVNDKNRSNQYQENWPQGVTVIRDYEGEYEFDFISIRNGVARYQGREYDGNA